MTYRAILIAATMLQVTPALAAVNPPAASGADARMRTVVYNPSNPVMLYAAPGASLRIRFGADETIDDVVVSDQGTIAPDNEPAQPAPTGPFASVSASFSGAGGSGHPPASCDVNMYRSVMGNFLYLKPVRDLDAQPLFVQTSRVNASGKVEQVAYTFELVTRPGALAAAGMSTIWDVSFTYPDRERLARAVAWRKRKAALDEAAREQLALMPAPPSGPSLSANWRYGYRGVAEVQPDGAWDDGRTTFLRFNGNRRVPNIYRRLPDGHESIPAYATEPDATGTTLRIARTETRWFLRDGDEAGCLFDLGPDPEGATSNTVADAALRRTSP